MAWIKKTYSKYEEFIVYVFFGALATAVDGSVYYLLYNYVNWGELAQWSASISKATAWTVAMLFAFFTNKPFVFKSHDWSANVVLQQFAKFLGCRVGTGLLDIGTLLITVDILGWNGNVMYIFSAVVVALLNYIGSKLLFKKK